MNQSRTRSSQVLKKPGFSRTSQPAEARQPRGLLGIPEWEAMKGRLRNLGHDEAVRECSYLSTQYRKMWRAMTSFQVNLDDILQTLQAKRIAFVLTGTHGIGGWTGKPRATHDVDILVRSGRNYARAVNALRALYPNLEVRQFAGMTAFFVPGETHSVIDVTYPHRTDIEETLKTAIWVSEGPKKYRIPNLECALANKYGAMLALSRDSVKRGQDALDFATMVKHSTEEGRQPIDLDRLAKLGEMVWPGGGGQEILCLVEEAKAGNVPNLNPPGRLP